MERTEIVAQMPNPKFVLKFLLSASMFNRRHRRSDWVLIFAIASSAATIALVVLYLLQRSAPA